MGWFIVTFLLGLSFLAMEVTEFRHLATEGNSWHRSGFLSSYFTLVGTHGLHIATGLLWMLVMLGKIARQGVAGANLRRLTLLSMFWHFLDVIWIFIFSIVYLLGAV
jgi:cytochrome o ubiquinol oxidase subunit 3